MKKITEIIILTAVILLLNSFDKIKGQVGQWRYHFAATTPVQVQEWGNEVYALRNTDILVYNKDDQSLSSLSKRNGLSGSDMTSFGYNSVANCLVIGSKDGNIDLYYGSDIRNMPEIKDKNIAGTSKSVNRIYMQGRYAYLACGFGVVVMDVQKQEFKETYYIGNNNSSIFVSDVKCDDVNIWASTEKGLKFADKNALNLNDYAAWTTDTTFGENTNVDRCCKVGEYWWTLVKGSNEGESDKLYKGKLGENWILLDTNDIKKISMISAEENYLTRGVYRNSTKQWSVDLLDKEGEQRYVAVINREYENSIPTDAYLDREQNMWAVGSWASIYRFDHNDGSLRSFYYWGPATNTAFSITGIGKELLVASGGYDANFVPVYNIGDISKLSEGNWSFLNSVNIEGYKDISAVTQVLEDPKEKGHLFVASATVGLIEIKNNKVINKFNPTNSPLENYGDVCRINAIAFDAEGDLWMLNPGSSKSLQEYRRDGTWKAYDISAHTAATRLSNIIIDYYQHIWLIENKDNIYVFEVNGDNIKGLQINENNGSSISTTKANCLIEDDLGHIWIGTDRGVKIIDKHATVFDNPNGNVSSVECKNIMVPSGEYIIELLKNEGVSYIIYDGANRKWIGTQSNGAFLVSSDGSKELEHFTENNTPLLSNQINTIGMTPFGGEIFFSTPQGLCSFQGTSTFREEGAKSMAFPNPVPPNYEGYVSVKNLPIDAEVKITDAAGRLIYEGRATGSQLSWNGFNMQGKRPSPGVLLVFASLSDGSERMVCKIFYAR